MKNIVLSIFLVVSFANELQAQLNDYKYIIVPKKFEGFKNENQYKTSTIVKHLFTQKGFNTVYEDKLPDDLQANRCLGLLVGLDNESSMFTTKATLILKDCSNVDIFSTAQGKSKKKEYEASFKEAITNAFRSFDGIGYNYTPKPKEQTAEPITVSFKNDVKKLEEDTNATNGTESVVEEKSKVAETTVQETARQVATAEEQVFEQTAPETSSDYRVKNTSEVTSSPVMKNDVAVLYAQELANGYQLVDSTPKIRMKLLKSSSPNVYIAESGTINGVVYTENGRWFFEYYNANELVTEELNIKF
ncbi:MAG: hypothetical protein Mars2KO_06720 [Maribacter sp.]